jgi:hypothetical protein
LGRDDRDIATSGIGEPSRQERGLRAPAAVGRSGRCAGELRDTVRHPHGRAADDDPVRPGGVPHDAGLRHVALGCDHAPDRDLLNGRSR